MNLRDYAHKTNNHADYKYWRNYVVKTLRQAKKTYYTDIISRKNNQNKISKVLGDLANNKKEPIHPLLQLIMNVYQMRKK